MSGIQLSGTVLGSTGVLLSAKVIPFDEPKVDLSKLQCSFCGCGKSTTNPILGEVVGGPAICYKCITKCTGIMKENE
jgi:hypothetical protein